MNRTVKTLQREGRFRDRASRRLSLKEVKYDEKHPYQTWRKRAH